MGWLIALAIILLLAVLPLGVSAIYDAGGPIVRIIAGPVRLQLIPSKKKKPKKEKEPKQKPEKPKKDQKAKPNKKKEAPGGPITDFLPLLYLALDFLWDFLTRKLRVNRLEAKIVLAGDDPCDLAVNYGRAWAALGNLVPQLERFFVIKKRDMQVECDFTADKTLITARVDITITLGRLIGLVSIYGFKILREYLKIRKSRKGGAIK